MDTPPSTSSVPPSPEPAQPPAPTTPWLSRYRTPLLVLVPILTLALGVGLGFLLWGSGGNQQAKIATAIKATQQVLNPPPQNVKRYDVPVDDDPAYGPVDAPITIIEFSDYQ